MDIAGRLAALVGMNPYATAVSAKWAGGCPCCRNMAAIALVSGEVRSEPATTSAKYEIVVEQHEDGFVAYPLGFAGCVVGQGDNAD